MLRSPKSIVPRCYDQREHFRRREPVPVYKFRVRKTSAYIYTISEAVKRQWLARPKKLQYRGVAFTASTNTAGRPVYRFAARRTAVTSWSSSESAKRTLPEQGESQEVAVRRCRVLRHALARAVPRYHAA